MVARRSMALLRIETNRLLLRPFVAGDIDWLAPLYADEETRRYFPDGRLSREQTLEELDWFIGGGDPRFPGRVLGALIEKATGAPVGRAGLLGWEIDGRRETEIAYLVARERWREGFGAEIASALVRYGFGAAGVDRLVALIHPDNLSSIRTAQRAGLALEREIELEGARCKLYAIERWQQEASDDSARLERRSDSVQV